MTATLDAVRIATAAREDADRLASQAQIDIRLLSTPAEMADASALLARVWNVAVERAHVDPGLLVALAHSDNYVAGAYRNGSLCAAVVGFFHPPDERALHSHIAGVDGSLVGRGIGKALKFHQRAWALTRGAHRMTWTFDPLVARNAYFNIHALGTRAVRYLPDFYGVMLDGINAGQGSDRLLVEWRLDEGHTPGERHPSPPTVLRVADDRPQPMPVPTGARAVRVDLPADIEQLRRRDPEAAAQWRAALRECLATLMAQGWEIVDVTRSGSYLLEMVHP